MNLSDGLLKIFEKIEKGEVSYVSFKIDASLKDAEVERLQKEIYSMKEKFEWLVSHSMETASISKAKGAELLGIPLIDMDDFLCLMNKKKGDQHGEKENN